MNRPTNRRKKQIIDPDFQYGLIRKTVILALLLISASIISTALVYNVYGNMHVEVAQPTPFMPFDGLKPVEDRTILGLLWPVMTISLVVTLVVTLIFGVVVSRRMAGPVFSIRRALRDMAQGDLKGELSLRHGDAFRSLADEVNNLKEQWRLSIQELQMICRQFDAADAPEYEQELKQMHKILSGFKTT